jgi:hypothetical protein
LVQRNPNFIAALGDRVLEAINCLVYVTQNDDTAIFEHIDVLHSTGIPALGYKESHSITVTYQSGAEAVVEIASRTIDEASDTLEQVTKIVAGSTNMVNYVMASSAHDGTAPLPISAFTLQQLVKDGNLSCILGFHKVALTAEQQQALAMSSKTIEFDRCSLAGDGHPLLVDRASFAAISPPLRLIFKSEQFPNFDHVTTAVRDGRLGYLEIHDCKLAEGQEVFLKELVDVAKRHCCEIILRDITHQTESWKELRTLFGNTIASGAFLGEQQTAQKHAGDSPTIIEFSQNGSAVAPGAFQGKEDTDANVASLVEPGSFANEQESNRAIEKRQTEGWGNLFVKQEGWRCDKCLARCSLNADKCEVCEPKQPGSAGGDGGDDAVGDGGSGGAAAGAGANDRGSSGAASPVVSVTNGGGANFVARIGAGGFLFAAIEETREDDDAASREDFSEEKCCERAHLQGQICQTPPKQKREISEWFEGSQHPVLVMHQ